MEPQAHSIQHLVHIILKEKVVVLALSVLVVLVVLVEDLDIAPHHLVDHPIKQVQIQMHLQLIMVLLVEHQLELELLGTIQLVVVAVLLHLELLQHPISLDLVEMV